MSAAVRVAPSVLSADLARLAEQVHAVEVAGADWLHVDVMDGHFVPNLTFGPMVVAALKRITGLYLDTHLMVSEPGRFLRSFADAGSGGLTVHVEVPDVGTVLRDIRAMGLRAGLALKPGTPLEAAKPFLDRIDLLLIMTVEPGFGGQKFREDMLPKLSAANNQRRMSKLVFDLEVDGGIGPETVGVVTARGADALVAGNSIFPLPDPGAALRRLREGVRPAES